MPQKKHKPEEIVAKLRQVDVLLSQGRSVPIPTKPPLCSDLIAPPDSEMISPPGAGAWLAV